METRVTSMIANAKNLYPIVCMYTCYFLQLEVASLLKHLDIMLTLVSSDSVSGINLANLIYF